MLAIVALLSPAKVPQCHNLDFNGYTTRLTARLIVCHGPNMAEVYHDASRYVQEGFSSSVQPLLAWLEAHRLDNPCECHDPRTKRVTKRKG